MLVNKQILNSPTCVHKKYFMLPRTIRSRTYRALIKFYTNIWHVFSIVFIVIYSFFYIYYYNNPLALQKKKP